MRDRDVLLNLLSTTAMASSSSPQPQQINVTDLDVPQLADVRKQLEEVRFVGRVRMMAD